MNLSIPEFEYKAIGKNGNMVTGGISAENSRLAARLLRRQGLTLTSLHEIKVSTSGSSWFRPPTKISQQELTGFMERLCVLLESEVPVDETISSLTEAEPHPVLKEKCKSIGTALRGGHSFSTALENAKLKIPSYFHLLTKAGEATGSLASALRDGLDQWQYEIESRKKLIGSLTYPAILVISGIAAVMLIFLIVVPKFVKILEKGSGDIPWLARMVMGTGQLFHDNVYIILALTVIVVILVCYLFADKKFRRKVMDLLAAAPLTGVWLVESDTGRWAAMLAALLEHKVELITALELAQHNITITSLKQRFGSVTKSVRGGVSIAEALLEARALPVTGINLVKVGEQSGKLPAMLRSLARLSDTNVKTRMARFLALVEPFAILLIGAVVGVIMAGLILGITSVNDVGM